MKDKLSKVKNLVKKYGLTGTIKKMTGYIYSNYIVRISMKEKIYVALNKKEIRKRLKRMLEIRLRPHCGMEKFFWMGCASVSETAAYFY